MSFNIGAVIIMGIAGIGSFAISLCAREAGAVQLAPSVWDGVYTEEQAKRGEALYVDQCARCHGASLEGGEMGRGLVGNSFGSDWNDMSVGGLFERVRVSMPQDNPGRLSRQQTAEILAFVLSKNDFPAGRTELPTQTDVLNQMKFLASKPD